MLLDIKLDMLPPPTNQLYRKNAAGAIYTRSKVIGLDKRKRDIDNHLKPCKDSIG
jgi:hypothetical protein